MGLFPDYWILNAAVTTLAGELTTGENIGTKVNSIALLEHYNDIIMSVVQFEIISLTIVYSTVYSGTDQWKH